MRVVRMERPGPSDVALVRAAGIEDGDLVLVAAAGGVGSLLAQLARNATFGKTFLRP